MKPSISIIIPTFNGKKFLQHNLPAVLTALKYADKGGEIIVVDDGSRDNTARFLARHYPQIKVARHRKNRGWGAAIETGAKAAAGKLVYLVSNDIRPNRNAIKTLLLHFRGRHVFAAASRQKLGLLKSGWLGAPIPIFSYGLLGYEDLSRSQNLLISVKIFFADQAAAMFDRKKLLALLGNQNIYGSSYFWNDVDISYRALKQGLKIISEPKSKVLHLHQSSRSISHYWQEVLQHKNRLIFNWRNLSSKRLVMAHLFWLPIRISLSIFYSSRGKFALGFLLTLPKIPQIFFQRIKLHKNNCVADSEILNIKNPLPKTPKLAILTQSIRRDNHAPLKYFKKIKVFHFYHRAPYGDLKMPELKDAIRYQNMRDLWKKLKKLNPDIIQGAEPYGSKIALKTSLLALCFAKKFSRRLIFGVWENRPAQIRFSKLLSPILKRILLEYGQNADIIFAQNLGAQKNLLSAGVDLQKIHRLPWGLWGIDKKLFHQTKKKPVVFKNFQYNIFFAGRLDEAKGIKYLLESFKIVSQKVSSCQLILAGNGPLKDQIISFARRFRLNIRLLGMLKNTDLPPYFSAASVTVYPSITLRRWAEQVGTVNLQALACGCPLVTTKSGAIPEYIKNNQGAILVKERNAQALAGAILKIIQDPKLSRRLAGAGPKYIQKYFDAKKNVQMLEDFLLKKLNE